MMDKITNVATILFEWDCSKAESNRRKHGLSFEITAMVFMDPNRFEAQDTRAKYGEDRWKTVGVVQEHVLCVIYTIRYGDTIRLISGRYANAKERQQYDQVQP